MRIIVIYFLTYILSLSCMAQRTVDSILSIIAGNNKEIVANQRYWEARRVENSTGLTLYDPQVEYDHLFGSPEGAGIQRDFTISQRVDFPTVYGKKKTLYKEQKRQTVLEHQAFRQELLLKIKLLLLDQIALNKRQQVLVQRFTEISELTESYRKRLDKGEATILDMNKARLQLMTTKNEMAMNENEIMVKRTLLAEYNGGIDITINDTVYPVLPLVPDFQTLDSTIEANDPVIKVYDQETVVLSQQIKVQKALRLPAIEAGYHSQSILGQSYRGVHTGFSIPLWENRNKLKAAQANLHFANANREHHRTEHQLENKQLYDQLTIRRSYMDEYNQELKGLNNSALLDKALRLGEITVTSYLQDQSFYYTAYDRYLQIELEYHKAVATLYKFLL